MIDVATLRRQAEAPSVATRADLSSVVDDLSAAFADDVAFDWFLRTDSRRDEARHRLFHTLVHSMAFGRARIDRPADGGAAALWLPFDALSPTPLLEELRTLPTMLFATGIARFQRLALMRANMDKHHPMDRPHAYLWFLGVTPAAQDHGVGSAMLRHATARLDVAGEHAYLETQTERNLALYRRHGFEVISQHRARADAPMLWSMWREPQSPSHA